MNWQKTRGILLVSLAIANLILFFFLIGDYLSTRDETMTKSFLKNTKELLMQKNIELDCFVPRNVRKLSSLLVEFTNYNEENLNETFFSKEAEIKHPSSDRVELKRGDELINLVNSRRIFYENTDEKEIYKNLDEDKAIEICQNFLVEHKMDPTDMELGKVRFEDGKYYLDYNKVYENLVLQSSYTSFVVDERGVVSMDRLWLKVLDKSDRNIKISSAPKALLSLLDKEEYYGKKIVNIEECYYFNPEDQGYVDDITKALQGRAIPAWKIDFSDGENIVIDNY